jgi:hypothetical protein
VGRYRQPPYVLPTVSNNSAASKLPEASSVAYEMRGIRLRSGAHGQMIWICSSPCPVPAEFAVQLAAKFEIAPGLAHDINRDPDRLERRAPVLVLQRGGQDLLGLFVQPFRQGVTKRAIPGGACCYRLDVNPGGAVELHRKTPYITGSSCHRKAQILCKILRFNPENRTK